jgi:3-oxoacyl-[acyl-carrier protein] reductase
MEGDAMESRLLAGHGAFVTGGARGIGAAICRRLAGHGAAVAVSYRRSRDAAERLVAAIAGDGGQAVAAPVDVTDAKAAAKALRRAAEALGRELDVIVHNAWPGWKGGAFDEVPWSTYQWYVDQMLRPAVELTRAALPPMQAARWGRVVLLGTSAMYELNQGHAPYLAAKGAMLALARGMARDLGQDGITVNMVSPGLVWTGDGPPPAGFGDEHRGRSALGRLPTPDDVAGAVVFLASRLADAITGVHLPVTCGSPMHVG